MTPAYKSEGYVLSSTTHEDGIQHDCLSTIYSAHLKRAIGKRIMNDLLTSSLFALRIRKVNGNILRGFREDGCVGRNMSNNTHSCDPNFWRAFLICVILSTAAYMFEAPFARLNI